MANPQPASRKPKRGVSLYSYSGEYGVTMTIEDMFADIHDLGADGLEILGNSHIDGYPEPTDAWVENWFRLLAQYQLKPVEYGHWVDSRLYPGRELSTQESYALLQRDLKLAGRLGFPFLRTKLGVIDDDLTPVTNWREFIALALPLAEEHNVCMCPEIHTPTVLKSKMVDDYVEFIEKHQTKHFGINIDFSVFQTNPLPMWEGQDLSTLKFSPVEDIVPLLPYTPLCHAKFVNMSEDFVETTTPYDKILGLLSEHKWDGYLLSEYEGPHKDVPGYSSSQLRRHHILLKRLLGER